MPRPDPADYLNLHPVTTAVYFDAVRMDPEIAAVLQSAAEDQCAFYDQLTAAFTNLRFVPSPKGERIERLRRKLRALTGKRKVNEIVQGGLDGLLERTLEL